MVETNKYAFDLEGTLVNLESWHQYAFEEVAESLGVVFGITEFNKFVGAGDEAISEEIAKLAGSIGEMVDPVKVRGLKTLFIGIYYIVLIFILEWVFLNMWKRLGLLAAIW